MKKSDTIFLLARQRSGTNALRSALETHPDIYCHNEVFNLADLDSTDDPKLREINFFNFQAKYARSDPRLLLPSNHENLFLDFLEYLRCFTSKRYMLIDVKYNTTHFLTEPNKWMAAPYLFYLIKTHGLRVMNLTRRNYLRYAISTVKAEQTGVWTVPVAGGSVKDQPVTLEIDYLMRLLDACDVESRMVDGYFANYAGYRVWEYEDAFTPEGGGVSSELLRALAAELGIADSFEVQTRYGKQSYLPLEETIENYDEVAAALRGTRFEYCLDDERAYRGVAVVR
jgi:hypothetical protein